jgi:hypothetical protein
VRHRDPRLSQEASKMGMLMSSSITSSYARIVETIERQELLEHSFSYANLHESAELSH